MSIESMAAHQPVWQVYAFFGPLSSLLQQAAIVFTPTFSQNKMERSEFSRTMLMFGLLVGVISGVICMTLFNLTPFAFTNNSSLWSLMASLTPFAFIALCFCAVDVVQEGLLIANGNGAFLGFAMWINVVVVFVCTNAFEVFTSSVDIFSVWWCLVLFFVSRILLNASRLNHISLFSH